MNSDIKKPLIYFGVLTLLFSLVFFLFPINLFDGEIVLQEGLTQVTIERQLSLSYFIGLGYEESEMVGIADFYLTAKGYAMAFIFILGFPALIAYRIYLRKFKS